MTREEAAEKAVSIAVDRAFFLDGLPFFPDVRQGYMQGFMDGRASLEPLVQQLVEAMELTCGGTLDSPHDRHCPAYDSEDQVCNCERGQAVHAGDSALAAAAEQGRGGPIMTDMQAE